MFTPKLSSTTNHRRRPNRFGISKRVVVHRIRLLVIWDVSSHPVTGCFQNRRGEK